MSQGAMEGGATHAQGWVVCRKEPWKAVRRMPKDGLADICSCNICTSTIRGGRMLQ